MNNLKKILRIGYPTLKTDFLIIFGWLLLAPNKEKPYYYLISATIILLLIFKEFQYKKHFELSIYTKGLILINSALILSQIFSMVYFSSLLFLVDLVLISFFFSLFPEDQTKEDLLKFILFLISVFSFLIFLNMIFLFTEPKNLFFINPIVKSAITSVGLIISFFKILEKFSWKMLVLLLINLFTLYFLGSKSAFLASCILLILIFLKKRKVLIKYLILIVIFTLIIPNPIKKSFLFFLKKDPYAYERINIWKSGLNMFVKHLPYGVGLGNYSKISPQYNFKTEYAPANYLKYPQRTHNSYLQILCETGIFGLLFLLIFFTFIIKKFVSSGLTLPLALLLLIVIQGFFYNIIFKLPIFFLCLFLIKLITKKTIHYISFLKDSKISLSIFLISLFFLLYFFPFISSNFQKKAALSTNPLKLLKNASLFTPLDFNIYFRKAQIFYESFKQNPTWTKFFLVQKNLKSVHKLNKFHKASYLLESELYLTNAKIKNIKYSNLIHEITAPLILAEKYFPFDPFIKFQKSIIYLEFSDLKQSKTNAESALQLEPEFIRVLWFLYNNFSEYHSLTTLNKINKIVKKHNLPYTKDKIYLKYLFDLPLELQMEFDKNDVK